MSIDVVYSYYHGDTFAKKLTDISDIGKKVGFCVPVKISHQVKAYIAELGLPLINVVGFAYKVYPDDDTFVSIKVPEVTGKKIWVMTCLEFDKSNVSTVVICIFFPSEYEK